MGAFVIYVAGFLALVIGIKTSAWATLFILVIAASTAVMAAVLRKGV